MLILFLWIISIMVCLNRYSKLRSLYPVVPPHKYTNKGPMHIEESKNLTYLKIIYFILMP